jgi:predicted RNA methylase
MPIPSQNTVPRPYLAGTFRGLGGVARIEIRDRLKIPVDNMPIHPIRNFDLIRFDYSAPPGNLARLGTVEDLFFIIEELPLTGTVSDLKTLRNHVLRSPRLVTGLAVLAEYRHATGRKPVRTRGQAFRVPCSAEDAPWRQYQRTDLKRAVTVAIKRVFPDWKPVEDDGDIEIWIHQSGRRAFVSLRLSDIAMRQRDYKTVNLPASLRPTIARAMALLSRMGDSDVVLDPMCGAGTILIERALAGRYKQLIGGDIDPEAVAAARTNLGPRHKPWELHIWDATRIPVPDASVDRIITNPPWGRQIGSRTENVPLYQGFLREADRVLKPEGLAVVLTSEWNLLRETLRHLPGLIVVRTVKNVSVLGWHADIVIIAKRDGRG